MVQLLFFCFQLWGNSETSQKTKRLNKNEIKKQLIEFFTINNAIKIEELNERAEEVEKPEEAVDIIKEYKQILRIKKKGMIVHTFYQGAIPTNDRDVEDSQWYDCV